MKQLARRSFLGGILTLTVSNVAASTWQLRSPLQYPNLFTQQVFRLSANLETSEASALGWPFWRSTTTQQGDTLHQSRRFSHQRTPYHHKQTAPTDQPSGCFSSKCIINPWAFAYHRSACSAYPCDDHHNPFGTRKPCCNTNPCCQDSQISIPGLIFGKESFRVEEAFAGARLDPIDLGSNYNPNLSSFLVTPKLKYKEKGIIIGTNAQVAIESERCDQETTIVAGVRAYLPYRWLDMELRGIEEETQVSVTAFPATLRGAPAALDSQQGTRGIDYAYRLDYAKGSINFGDGTNPTRIAAGKTSYSVNMSANTATQAPVYLVKRCPGTMPQTETIPTSELARFGRTSVQVEGALPSDGNVPENTTHFLASNTDYTPLYQCDDLLRTFYIVPHLNLTNGGSTTTFFGGQAGNTATIRDAIGWGIYGAHDKALSTQFLGQQCGMNLRTGDCISGLGNLVTDFYLGYCRPRYGIYGIFGLAYPTDQPVKEASARPYIIPPGNNNHYEIKVGTEGGGVFGYDSFRGSFEFLFHYNHVAKRKECRPAEFQCAAVRNIGPTVTADVSWNYYLLRLNLAGFFLCCRETTVASCYGIGADLGYEYYHKDDDQIRFCQRTAIDCYGRQKPLDDRLLSRCTDTTTHKILGKFFYALPQCRLFVGGSHIFSGRSALVESEIVCGIMATF